MYLLWTFTVTTPIIFILFSSVKRVCSMVLKSSQWWFKDNLTVVHCV